MIIERNLKKLIKDSIKKYPVVGLIGCRQVGKTTLAGVLQKGFGKRVIYLDLELPSDLAKLHDPELYLTQFTDSLVIIDEIQRMPSLFALIRALVDKKRVGGRFLILGSASPHLIKHASETLAGRIIYHELTPLTIAETGDSNINKLWLRGGFPDSYLSVVHSHQNNTSIKVSIPRYLRPSLCNQIHRLFSQLSCVLPIWNSFHSNISSLDCTKL